MSIEACEVLQVAKSATYESCITFVYVLRCEERTLTFIQAFTELFSNYLFRNWLWYLKWVKYIKDKIVDQLNNFNM